MSSTCFALTKLSVVVLGMLKFINRTSGVVPELISVRRVSSTEALGPLMIFALSFSMPLSFIYCLT